MWGAGLLYLTLKTADLLRAGDWPLLLTTRPVAMWVWAELIAFLVVPLLLWPWTFGRRFFQWCVPLLFVTGVTLNRFDATLFGQHTPAGAIYTPHLLEWASTLGIVAGAALVWYLGVRYLVPPAALQQAASPDTHA